MYYQKADGTFVDVKNGGIIIYYLGRGQGTTTPFPPGFKMVSGTPGCRAYDNTTKTYNTASDPGRPVADRVSFKCIDYVDPDRPETPGFPANMSCPQGLRAQIQFPSCWDGVNLYKSDQSHVAYLSQIDNGVCPPTHPKLLPHLFYEMYYNIDSVNTSDGGRFLLATGDTTGYGYHGDFLNGWNPDVQARAVSNCLASSGSGQIEDCPDLKASNDPNAGSNCPLQPALVDEQIAGVLQAIPGCNPPTSGPGPATQQACPGKLIAQNITTDGQTRQVPVPGNTTATLSSGSKIIYQGCFSDDGGSRALSKATYADSSSMTTESCGNFCQSKGYSVFGTEYASECYCGDSINSTNASQSDCSMTCKGNLATYCGGPNRLSVWKIGTASSSSSVTTTTSIRSSTSSSQSTTTARSSSTTSTTTTSSAPAGATIKDATYLGCYTDNVNSRALSGYYSNTNTQTLDTCSAAAMANNYKYFGVEYSGECFAGNSINSASTKGSTACTMTCNGNSSQICGGPNAVSMFQSTKYVEAANKQSIAVSNSTSSASYGYKGCYTDAAVTKRTLSSYSFTNSTMTVELCLNTCFAKGWSWAGVEYASECYCGDDKGIQNGATVVADTDCSMRCAGDKTEWCGAGSRMNVYQKQTVRKPRSRQ